MVSDIVSRVVTSVSVRAAEDGHGSLRVRLDDVVNVGRGRNDSVRPALTRQK